MVNIWGERPLYSLATVKKLVRQGDYSLVTRLALDNYAALGFSQNQFVAVIGALMATHFRGVHPNCRASNSMTLDCDSYRIEIDRELLIVRRGGGTKLYLKLAVASSGQLVAFFSCHD